MDYILSPCISLRLMQKSQLRGLNKREVDSLPHSNSVEVGYIPACHGVHGAVAPSSSPFLLCIASIPQAPYAPSRLLELASTSAFQPAEGRKDEEGHAFSHQGRFLEATDRIPHLSPADQF